MKSWVLVFALPAAVVASSCGGHVRYLGRVNPATKELTWPSTGVAFTFTGTSASIGIEEVTGANSVELTVDGSPIAILDVQGPAITTPVLPYGNHSVSLRKRSEAQYGTIFLGNVTSDGTIAPDVAPTRQIEIIGDSISVGYGLDGTNPCSDSAAVQNNPKTYAALAANALNADYSAVAWSGKGIIRNYVEALQYPLIPELYSRYGGNDAKDSYTFPSTWNPDAIVIGLGTNDWGFQGWDANGQPINLRDPIDTAEYTAAMVAFIQSIQEHYPDAVFFLVTSPMLSNGWPPEDPTQKADQTQALADVIEALGGDNVHLVDWPSQGSDVGCDYHPNAATNAAQAEVLTAAISEALGW